MLKTPFLKYLPSRVGDLDDVLDGLKLGEVISALRSFDRSIVDRRVVGGDLQFEGYKYKLQVRLHVASYKLQAPSSSPVPSSPRLRLSP